MIKIIKLTTLLFLSFQTIGQIDTMALKTPEGVASKFLEFISFEKDEVKDWDEFRNLFLPSVQMTSIKPDAPPHKQVSTLNLEEFVRYAGPNYPSEGFKEIVIGLDVKEFNGIATVFQSFHCETLSGSYEARGVNTYQLVYLNNRWWIASSMFTNETEDVKLPDELLYEQYQTKPLETDKKK